MGVTPAGPPLVSILLAVRNEAGHLSNCLDAVAAQTWPVERLEIIVADGCSTDGSVAIARGYDGRPFSVRVVQNPAVVTPAGFNAGLRAARGSVIVILGARAQVAPDFVAESVAALERTGAEAVGGVVESRADESEGAMARAIARALRSPFGVGDARYRYSTREQETDTVNYGAYRRAVFDRIGAFDEELAWVEDDEFNYRLRAAGGHVVVTPRIRVRYSPRATLRELWRQQFHWGLNKPRVARRHPGQMRPRHAVPALFVATLASSALLSPVSGRARRLLAATTVAYIVAAGLASVRSSRSPVTRHPLPVTLLLPAVFATMHIAYGSGMLIGLTKGTVQRVRCGRAP